jgi:hypothetical protein
VPNLKKELEFMKTKYWILTFVLLVVVASIVHLLISRSETEGPVATVYQDSVPIATIYLNEVEESHEINVTTEDGNVNIVLVEPGQISVRYATCPDQVCVLQGPISNSARPIVCLPHRLSIEITDGSETDIDVVAGT